MKSTKFLTGILSIGVIVSASIAMADPKLEPAKPASPTKTTEPAKKDAGKDAGKDKKDDKKMTGLAIGAAAPDFKLKDTNGKEVKLSDYKGKIVVIEWFNPGCPAIAQHHEKAKTFNDMFTAFKGKDVVMLAINSSAAGKEGSKLEDNQAAIKKWSMEYPVLMDTDGTVGHSFGATNTPHCFVIGKDGNLAYKGAIDNGSFGKNGDKNYVKQAVEQLLKGETVTEAETKAYGCSVKYDTKK
jgi:peroxiredoxin